MPADHQPPGEQHQGTAQDPGEDEEPDRIVRPLAAGEYPETDSREQAAAEQGRNDLLSLYAEKDDDEAEGPERSQADQ